MKRFTVTLSITLGLGLALTLLWLLDDQATPAIAASALSGVEGTVERPLFDATPIHYVAITGADNGDCSTPVSACLTTQYTVDQAGEGDEIRIAAGVYAGVQGRPAPAGYNGPSIITQVVYISKTVTIRGGYTTAFTDPPDPEANSATLDAQGQGRVIFITGDISPTVEGLHITGGDAAGLDGYYSGNDAGGGVYVITATATISNNWVFSNTADWYGGGLYLYTSAATLSGNTVTSNSATANWGSGGGLFSMFSPVTLVSNTISFNTANSHGGGLSLDFSDATLSGNTVTFNTASGSGGMILQGCDVTLNHNIIAGNTGENVGGLYLNGSTATLNNNTITGNTADYSGGLFQQFGDVTLIENTISYNTGNGLGLWVSDESHHYYGSATLISNTISGHAANSDGGGLWISGGPVTLTGNTVTSNTTNEDGGGLWLGDSDATLIGNTVTSNTASGDGGGLFLNSSPATLIGNTFTANTASNGGGLSLYLNRWWNPVTLSGNIVTSNTAYDYGGGLYLYRSYATLTNTVIANNQSHTAGNGLYILGYSTRLLHTTIARNSGGDGSGVYVTGYLHEWTGTYYPGTVALTNTILVSHTVGITVVAGNTARLEATLWGTDTWANTTDWGGAGTVVTGTINVWGDPAFVNPDAGDYHIGLGSAAADAGVDAGVPDDIDGDPRTDGHPDLGADELGSALLVTKQAYPDPVQPGAQLTYTIRVINIGYVTLHATVTDTLPIHIVPGETSSGTLILPGGQITWTPIITALGGIWTETVVVTVEMGYTGTLTNVVQVTTEEEASGVYTETSEAGATPMLEVIKEAKPEIVQAGAQLTYTIRVTNTGYVTLHATVTDTLPTHITGGETSGGTVILPGGQITWTTIITAPGGVWTEQVVVTVTMAYSGTLANIVEVTTDEDVMGVYTRTSTAVAKYTVYLPLVLRNFP